MFHDVRGARLPRSASPRHPHRLHHGSGDATKAPRCHTRFPECWPAVESNGSNISQEGNGKNVQTMSNGLEPCRRTPECDRDTNPLKMTRRHSRAPVYSTIC